MKNKQKIITIILILSLILIIKNNNIVKLSVLNSIDMWIKYIVPSILPMYIFVDLFINYTYFKNSYLLLIIINMLLGTPSNAKYIKEFYLDKKIDLNTSNYLLLFTYSPSPLFIINIVPNIKDALTILSFIYITNILLFIITRPKLKSISFNHKVLPLNKCLYNSLMKTYNILLLILGIIVFYMIIITIINLYFSNAFIFNIILEITNGIKLSLEKTNYLKYILFITSFGGLSIHLQIKSILEDTPINYNYFLFGRLFQAGLSLIFMFK